MTSLIRNFSVLSSVILSLAFGPWLIASYDCTQLNPTNDRKCPNFSPGPQVPYPKCLVAKLSVSAFIQCSFSADDQGPDEPQFSISNAGGSKSVGALGLLTQALNKPDCDSCPLASVLGDAARSYGMGIGEGPFSRFLCGRNPTDAGICCLRRCLQGVLLEHSIEAFCRGQVGDLMRAPLVKPCATERDNNAVGGQEEDNSATTESGEEDISSDDDVSSVEDTPSNGNPSGGEDNSGDKDVSSVADTPSNGNPSGDENTSTTSDNSSPESEPSTSSPAPATDTSVLPSPPPQETPSIGAGSGKWWTWTYTGRMKRLLFAVMPMIAFF